MRLEYPDYCDEDVRCDEVCDGLGCPYLNEDGECNISNADADIRPCEDDNDDFKEQIDNMSGMAIIMLEEFMQDCRKMAQENWCPSQVEMLDRLFKAVSLDEKYDEV